MKPLPMFVLVLLTAQGLALASEAASPTPAPVVSTAAAAVAVSLDTWKDGSREGRSIPVKIYAPSSGNGPFPLVVVSHGLGGTREGLEYLGRALAARGYIALHLQHPGSDDAVWRESRRPMQAMRTAARDVDNLVNRPRDVTFALDEVTRRAAASDPLWTRADLSRVAVAGHSFGAWTALVAAGRTLRGPAGAEFRLGDGRVRACIALSAPANPRDATNGSYDSVQVPCLHMTGTEDSSPIGDTTPEQRRIPFDAITGADQYLLIFEGGDHMVFGGPRARRGLGALRGNGLPAETEARFQRLIVDACGQFLDSVLRSDEAAKEDLRQGGFARRLGADGTWEFKPGNAPAPGS